MKRPERIYYAHSKMIYDTPREAAELRWLKRHFTRVCCPNHDLGELGSIGPYLRAIDLHDAVVCSEYQGHIGKGTYHEIDHALGCGRKVWVMRRVLGLLVLRRVKRVELVDTGDWKVGYARIRI